LGLSITATILYLPGDLFHLMSSFDANPYTTPAFTSPPPIIPGTIFREGKFLIVRNGTVLPDFCPVNAEPVAPAPNGYRKPRPIAWAPPWVFLGLLMGLLPLIIFMLVAQKRGQVTYALGPVAKKRMRNRRLTGTVLLLLAIGLIFGVIQLASRYPDSSATGVIGLLIPVLFITSMVFFIISQPITVAGYQKEGWFKLKGCGPEFLNRFQEVNFKSLS